MFSVEYDWDEVCITVLDDTGYYSDLKIHAFDDIVLISQYDHASHTEHRIAINPSMWEDLLTAVHSPEGLFSQIRK